MAESYAGGALAGLSVNATYDTLLRRATINFQNGTNVLGSSTYGYDNASRLASVGDGTYSANYTYQANSSLLNAEGQRCLGRFTSRLSSPRAVGPRRPASASRR